MSVTNPNDYYNYDPLSIQQNLRPDFRDYPIGGPVGGPGRPGDRRRRSAIAVSVHTLPIAFTLRAAVMPHSFLAFALRTWLTSRIVRKVSPEED